ncbi:PEPxxWA-CTERM sorting domain-containing protein, partial [Escherichia fergusonii]|uniref:PEPxxWA-CTERM sorting domain-containing protein n=1 Tax=Escherichia fergusonii TaxID=564 RepID=UPI001CC11079
ANIAYVRFGGTGFLEQSNVYADNFTYEGRGVPEPATWAMMIAGFGLAGAAARSRRRASALA